MKAVVINDTEERHISGSGARANAKIEVSVRFEFFVIWSFIVERILVPWVNVRKQDFYAARDSKDIQALYSFAGGRSGGT
jgi:hypothetical protein